MPKEYLILADTIFRFTNFTDEVSTLADTEKIVFNSDGVPDTTGRLITTSFRMVSDLNVHPNPGIPLNQMQDSLLGAVEVTVAGYFIDHNNTLGPANLYNWSVDPDVNDTFEKGRFGLTLATMGGILNVIPTVGLNGIGYMLSEIEVIDAENPRTEVGFIAKFFLNGVPVNVSVP